MPYGAEPEIRNPFGGLKVQNLAYAATQNITITTGTFLNFAILTGDTTLNITPSSELRAGTMLHLKIPATANGDDLTLGTGIDAPVIVGVAGKTKTQSFFYDGSVFIPMGAVTQID